MPWPVATASASGLRLFAVRATTPLYTGGAEIPSNEVLLYWMETGDLGLRWPKYYAGYIHAWPTDLAKYSMYMRSLDAATATAVPLNAADNPALVYQDDPTKAHAAVSADLKFSTTVTAAAPVGRSLIRYTNGPNIWFERVYSQLDTAVADYATTTAANVGARLLPPTGTDSLVGYIRQASGTAFNPTAYRDPFVVGFDAAQQGAIALQSERLALARGRLGQRVVEGEAAPLGGGEGDRGCDRDAAARRRAADAGHGRPGRDGGSGQGHRGDRGGGLSGGRRLRVDLRGRLALYFRHCE